MLTLTQQAKLTELREKNQTGELTPEEASLFAELMDKAGAGATDLSPGVSPSSPSAPVTPTPPSLAPSTTGNREGRTPQLLPPTPTTTEPKTPVTLKKDANGKINWWLTLAPLFATGVGALIGGEKGAMAALAAGGGAFKGLVEGRKLTQEREYREKELVQEENRRAREESRYREQKALEENIRKERAKEREATETQRRKEREEEKARQAPATRTRHDIQGNEIVEQWDSNAQKFVRVGIGRRPERAPAVKPEKPLTAVQIGAELKLLTDEEKEIKESGTGYGTARTYTPEQQARLREIAKRKAELRSMTSITRSANPIIRAMGKTRKTSQDGAPTSAELTAHAKIVVDSGVTNEATGRPWTQAEAEAYILAEYQKKQSRP